MRTDLKRLEAAMEALRLQIFEALKDNAELSSHKVVSLSRELDLLVLEWYRLKAEE